MLVVVPCLRDGYVESVYALMRAARVSCVACELLTAWPQSNMAHARPITSSAMHSRSTVCSEPCDSSGDNALPEQCPAPCFSKHRGPTHGLAKSVPQRRSALPEFDIPSFCFLGIDVCDINARSLRHPSHATCATCAFTVCLSNTLCGSTMAPTRGPMIGRYDCECSWRPIPTNLSLTNFPLALAAPVIHPIP